MTASSAPRTYERQVGTAWTGLAAVIVGAWGALAGYIGPYFGFRPVAYNTWVTSLPNGILHLLPGAVAVGAGLMLLAMGPARRSVRNGAFLLPALLLLASGAWFVIGPLAWPVFQHGNTFLTGVTAARNLLNVACASYAPGLVLVMLGGMTLKAATVPTVAVEDPYTPIEADRVPPGTGRAPGAAMAGAGAGAAMVADDRRTGGRLTSRRGRRAEHPAADAAAGATGQPEPSRSEAAPTGNGPAAGPQEGMAPESNWTDREA